MAPVDARGEVSSLGRFPRLCSQGAGVTIIGADSRVHPTSANSGASMSDGVVRVNQVFVPGGLPRHTYVPRTGKGIEEKLRQASDNLCKLVTVTGATKSGKTVMTSTIYPRGRAVWLDGGTFGTEEDLWSEVVEQLDAFTETAQSVETLGELGAEIRGQSRARHPRCG